MFITSDKAIIYWSSSHYSVGYVTLHGQHPWKSVLWAIACVPYSVIALCRGHQVPWFGVWNRLQHCSLFRPAGSVLVLFLDALQLIASIFLNIMIINAEGPVIIQALLNLQDCNLIYKFSWPLVDVQLTYLEWLHFR